LIWALGWTSLAIRRFTSPGDRAMLLLVALLVPVGFGLHIWNVGRSGLGAVELARVAFWPPEWWGMWWPSFLQPAERSVAAPPEAGTICSTSAERVLCRAARNDSHSPWFAGENGQAPGEQSPLFVS
jgi:hypothetical protein